MRIAAMRFPNMAIPLFSLFLKNPFVLPTVVLSGSRNTTPKEVVMKCDFCFVEIPADKKKPLKYGKKRFCPDKKCKENYLSYECLAEIKKNNRQRRKEKH